MKKVEIVDKLKKLYIEPTAKCNLNCSMCFRNTWFDEIIADMSAVTFEKIVNNIPKSVETVILAGMGEPLVHDNIIDMVEKISAKGFRVEMLTNGSLLNNETSKELLKAGLKKLWISIDSFEEKSYEKIRINSTWAQLQDNLKNFNQNRKNFNHKIELGLAFVAMKDNIKQLEQIPLFAVRNEVDEVNISNLIPADEESFSQILYDKVLNWGLGILPKTKIPIINIPLMNWRQKEVSKAMKGLLSTSICQLNLSGKTLSRKTNYCRFIEENNTFIRHDGEISPCIALLHSSTNYWNGYKRTIYHHSFGNILEKSLPEIWQSKKYTDFRKRVKNFEFSPCTMCSGCDDWEQNNTDCYGNEKPTCGACLWAEGLISCP